MTLLATSLLYKAREWIGGCHPASHLRIPFRVWRDDSMDKSSCYSCKEPRLCSQHPHGGSQPAVVPDAGSPVSASDHHMHQTPPWCSTYMQTNQLYTKNNKMNKTPFRRSFRHTLGVGGWLLSEKQIRTLESSGHAGFECQWRFLLTLVMVGQWPLNAGPELPPSPSTHSTYMQPSFLGGCSNSTLLLLLFLINLSSDF